MADAKITALTSMTTMLGADLLPAVDMSGTATTKKITYDASTTAIVCTDTDIVIVDGAVVTY